jgi:integrase
MTRVLHKLTPGLIERKSKIPGSYGDGGGLYLYVTSKTGRGASWVYAYMLNGKSREMGLGSYPGISLPEARALADSQRAIKARGEDPIEVRESVRASERLSAAKAMTFRQCAEAYIGAHKEGWKNVKHRKQWSATLGTYAMPTLGELAVSAVDRQLVHKVLEPIWNEKPETARRLRGRIEAVLDYATARDYRAGENPARWKGSFEKLFPKRTKLQRVQHHAALPYRELPAFMAELRGHEGTASLALQFTILTCARTGEAISAKWSELDLDEEVWTVPSERTKTGRAHKVPLSRPTLTVLRTQHKLTSGKGHVFPGARRGKPLSNMAMLKTLERMGRQDLTVHGFRSTFRDWAEEMTNFQGSVAEAALGHIVGDKVEAAYRRGDLFEKRRKLMMAWAEYSTRSPSEPARVIPLNRRQA